MIRICNTRITLGNICRLRSTIITNIHFQFSRETRELQLFWSLVMLIFMLKVWTRLRLQKDNNGNGFTILRFISPIPYLGSSILEIISSIQHSDFQLRILDFRLRHYELWFSSFECKIPRIKLLISSSKCRDKNPQPSSMLTLTCMLSSSGISTSKRTFVKQHGLKWRSLNQKLCGKHLS